MAKDWLRGEGNMALKALCASRNITKSDIARLLDVTHATAHKYFTNPYLMTAQQYHTIAGALDVNVYVLMYSILSNQPVVKAPLLWWDEVIAKGLELQEEVIDPYANLMAKARRNSL